MKALNNFYLKILALLFMTIDHVGVIFQLGDIYRIIGRLAFPLFAFLIYQGYIHTRNRLHYFLRLLIFGLLIEAGMITISLLLSWELYLYRNIFLTLSFGLLSLIIFDCNLHIILKTLLISLLLFLSYQFNFDYSWYGVLYILSFRFYRYNLFIPLILQIVLNYLYYLYYGNSIQYYSLLSWIFIWLYNHKRGYHLKYFFYLFYPLHLVFLMLIHYLLNLN